MNTNRFFQCLIVCGALLTGWAAIFFISQCAPFIPLEIEKSVSVDVGFTPHFSSSLRTVFSNTATRSGQKIWGASLPYFRFFNLSRYTLVAQNVNDYLGPNKKVTGNPELIRVQVIVNDDPNPKGVQIEDAIFHQKNIPLKPRDIYGFRGQGSYQLPPGKYTLKWTVRHDKVVWPRTTTHEEEVNLSPRDLWIQITIVGETASIS